MLDAETEHLTQTELEAGLEFIRRSPKDHGRLELLVRRPAVDQREVLQEGVLSLAEGLVGDDWKNRGSSRTADGGPNPNSQINVMNVRVVALLARTPERRALAGDQLFVDLDLSADNLPPGTRLAVGEAVIEVTHEPHNGCMKFKARYGADALAFVNSPIGKQLHLRGINARVVQPGRVRPGDSVKKI